MERVAELEIEQIGKIYIGNLTYETRQSELKEFCETIGPVKDAKIIKRDLISLGFGFVDFVKEEDAKKACVELKGKILDGRAVVVEKARPQRKFEKKQKEEEDFHRPARRFRGRSRFRGKRNTREGIPSRDTLFISNLSYDATEEDLMLVFKEYGVKNARIVIDTKTGNSRGYGFVTFENEEKQALALKNMANVQIDDRNINLRVSVSYEKEIKDSE